MSEHTAATREKDHNPRTLARGVVRGTICGPEEACVIRARGGPGNLLRTVRDDAAVFDEQLEREQEDRSKRA